MRTPAQRCMTQMSKDTSAAPTAEKVGLGEIHGDSNKVGGLTSTKFAALPALAANTHGGAE